MQYSRVSRQRFLPRQSKQKPFFQAKLTVNQPNDVYEQEADAVAEHVMRLPDPSATTSFLPFNKVSVSSLQRKCASCEEEKVQRKETEEDEQPVQLKRISELAFQRKCADCEEEEKAQRKESGNAGGGGVAPNLVSEVISGNGKTLEKGIREFMESRMGQDFSDVQIHADSKAAASAQSINALAYTSGKHIVFNSGRYQPGTDSGKRLLAHELVHVGQQGGGIQLKPKAKPKNPCKKRILSEGTCEFLALHSKWICCDPDNGFKRPGREESPAEPGKKCSEQKWTPIFTCDSKCDKALSKGCNDTDNWMAIPPTLFKRSKCDDIYTICANGKKTTGYVRDQSSTKRSYEVSNGIQSALGVPVGDTFYGEVFPPGTKQTTIDDNKCCNS